jgi:TIGR03009 family protein
VCDGKQIYEHRFNTKQLVVIPIPPDMQGKEIVNGPLPFLFGAKAADLTERYWFRVARELCDEKFTRIGIHAKPKFQADLANFTDVFVILRHEPKELLMPMSMRLVSPDRSHADYRFNLKEARINARLDQWFSGMFMAPRVPFGWTQVNEPLQQSAQAVPATGGGPAANGAGQPQRQ